MAETQPNLPRVRKGKSLQTIGFSITPNLDQFASLARRIGIPSENVGDIDITLSRGPLKMHGEGIVRGKFNRTSGKIQLGIFGKGKKAREKFLKTTAHELDHFLWYLQHPNSKTSPRKSTDKSTPEGRRTYHRRKIEIRARRTARQILESGEEFNLLDYREK